MKVKKQWFAWFRQLISIILIIGLVSCQLAGIKDEETETTTTSKIETVDDIPDFSPYALHVIQREHYHQTGEVLDASDEDQVEEYQAYLEDRLIDLYPDVAYDGMINDILSIAEVEAGIQLNKTNSDDDPYASDYQTFTTVEDEIVYMGLDEDEAALLYALEALAAQDSTASLEDIEAVQGLAKNTSVVGTVLLISAGAIATVAVILGLAYSRMRQCEERAHNKAIQYYGMWSEYHSANVLYSGTMGDAYKHMYVSMLLRRYLTKWGSKTIMNYYENTHPNSFYGDTQMDYHNNLVGREGKYREFRGALIADLYNWEGWAINVKTYVNNEDNGINMDWESDPATSNSVIDEDIADVSNTTYVYYLVMER